MMRPQPDCWLDISVSTVATASPAGVKRLALRMKRRKIVSVTPAIGARTVAGRTSTGPMAKRAGTRVGAASRGVAPELCGLSIQCFFIGAFVSDKCMQVKRPPAGGLFESVSAAGHYFAAAASGLASALAYFRRKRSTRPAVSISFCLPVKNGWQAEQISTWMSPLCVERVLKLLPHAHWTRISSYAG